MAIRLLRVFWSTWKHSRKCGFNREESNMAEKKLHLIMPMGGAGSRFFKNGFVMPKPLIEINGKPFFYWATKAISNYIDVEDITFVVLQEHIDSFNIAKIIKKYFPDSNIVVIPELLNG